VSSVVRGPPQIYILPNKARPCLDKKNVLLLSVHIIINLSTEHLVWNLVADKQASIQPTIVPQFLSMQGPTTLCPEQTSRPWTECVCVCVCVHCFQCEISWVLLSVGWVFRTGTQTSISIYICAIIMILNHGCQKSNTGILSFVPLTKKTPKNQTHT
jgi:hypothetical protein